MEYLHAVKVRQIVVDDFCQALEDYFGDRRKIPSKIKSVVKKGEEEINGRIRVLRMADRVPWLAVDKYLADPLCNGEEDDRKWK